MKNNPNSGENKTPNRLGSESSPYLRQHMYNLVDWYPWGEEAFEKAKKEDKIIFLSIGYSTCHWCHVMAHESFEDKETADYMNKHYVSIKLDREERPDLDQIYQNVIQLTGRSGGWPLSIFMTPDKKPFFAGTYFPSKPRYGMISFLELLKRLYELYSNERKKIETSGDEIINILQKYSNKTETLESNIDIEENMLKKAFKNMNISFDEEYGGFGNSTKFPNFPALLSILRQIGSFEKNNKAEIPQYIKKLTKNIKKTLIFMSNGGIYDHIGGGFHRYSVDRIWLVPHFEKMLYDNAVALSVYSEAYQIFKIPRFKEIVNEIVEWLYRDMYLEDIGFYSAMDADSEGVEGKYYIWSKDELDKLLPNEFQTLFYDAYDISEKGNFESSNIMNRSESNKILAEKYNIPLTEVKEKLTTCKNILLKERENRVPPSTDTKILISWNSLVITGLYDAYKILGDNKIRNTAHKLIEFIKINVYSSTNKILYSVFDPKENKSKILADLDSYANYIKALFSDFLFYSDISTLNLIESLTSSVKKQFWDDDGGGNFFSSIKKTDLITRMKSGADMPMPNGNGVMAENLLQIYYYTQKEKYINDAETIIRNYITNAISNSTFYGALIVAIQWYLYGSTDICVILSEKKEEFDLLKLLNQYYLPRIHYKSYNSNEKITITSFSDKKLENNSSTYHFCHKFNCKNPTNDKNKFYDFIENIQPSQS